MQKLPLIEVTWNDAHSYGSAAWSNYDEEAKEVISHAETCYSVGYALPETNEKVVCIAASYNVGANDKIQQISGHMSIPRGMVVSIRKLR